MARKIIVGDQEFLVPDKFPKSGFTIGLILGLIFMEIQMTSLMAGAGQVR